MLSMSCHAMPLLPRNSLILYLFLMSASYTILNPKSTVLNQDGTIISVLDFARVRTKTLSLASVSQPSSRSMKR